MNTVLPPIDELLPHRGGMLLVERVLGWREDWVSVSATPQRGT